MFPDPLDNPPDWKKGGRVHNWQNYVGPRVREIWSTLSDAVKIAIAEDAEEFADREEWE